MLINNVNGERRASSMLKNSEFYIEVAKFVQAYTTIVKNPNEFLREIKEQEIDESADKLSWSQFVSIVQKCELGFKKTPSSNDLLVYYNYAVEIGTINPQERRIATVDDVAEAQKHYYNFVDEAKDKAEEAYLRQKRITEMRESETANVDNQLSLIKAGNYSCFAVMMFAVLIGTIGVVSFFFNNAIAETIGSIIPVWERRYVGAIILIVLSVVIFTIFDRIYLKTKTNYVRLKQASVTIFDRSDDTYDTEKELKHNLRLLKRELKVVQAELRDKTKRYDVKKNIEILKHTNKFYKKLCEFEDEYVSDAELQRETLAATANDEQEFAPIKLTKEQEENLRTVSKEAIKLEGQFDVEAYNEKFEKTATVEEEKEEAGQEAQSEEETKEQEEKELLESIDYIKSVLGFAQNEEDQKQENEKENEKEK